MEYVKYVCPGCFYEQKETGICPDCKLPLIANCSVRGNPVVGEHIHLNEEECTV
jgi:hypothetical protein